MMALALAFVADTVPKARTGSAMGVLGTMSAVGTALGPVTRRPPGRRARLAGDLPGQRAARCLHALLLAVRHLPIDRQRHRIRPFRVRHPRHAHPRPHPGRLRAGRDRSGTPFWRAQRRLAGRRRNRDRRYSSSRRGAGPASPLVRLAMLRQDPSAQRGPRHECARFHGDDGDARGRAVLPVRALGLRAAAGRPRDDHRAGRRGTDRGARRARRRSGRGRANDRRRTGRDSRWAHSRCRCCHVRSGSSATSHRSS